MKLLSFRILFLSLISIVPLASSASDAKNQPSSYLSDGAETFAIRCFDMPQQTTIDINECFRVKLDQLEWVKGKYLETALNRIKDYDKNDLQRQQQLISAFDSETKAWSELIDKAMYSVEVEYTGGTAIGIAMSMRKMGLIELQIHDIWDNWLRFEDSTPPLLPEPKFEFVQ